MAKTASNFVGRSIGNGAFKAVAEEQLTSSAVTYLAQNALGQTCRLIEIFPTDLVARQDTGTIHPEKGKEDAWAAIKDTVEDKMRRFRQLNHPHFENLDQTILENDTVYIVLADQDLRDFETANDLPAKKKESIGKALITALSYAHGFGLFGMPLKPSVLKLGDNGNHAVIMLRRFIDGTTDFDVKPKSVASLDCITLSETIYELITGTAPQEKYQPLAGRLEGYDPRFLKTIDRCLSDQAAPFPTAIEWQNTVLGHLADLEVTRRQEEARWRTLRWASSAVVFATFIGVLWFGPNLIDSTAGDISLVETDVQSTEIANKNTDLVSYSANQDAVQKPDLIDLVQNTERETAALQAQRRDQAQSLVGNAEVEWTTDLPFTLKTPSDADGKYEISFDPKNVDPVLVKLNPWLQDGLILVSADGKSLTEDFDIKTTVKKHLSAGPNITPISLGIQQPGLPLTNQVALTLVPTGRLDLGNMTLSQIKAQNDEFLIWVSEIEGSDQVPFRVGDIIVDGDPKQAVFRNLKDVKTALLDVLGPDEVPIKIKLLRNGVDSLPTDLTSDALVAALGLRNNFEKEPE